jgi:hypothetical protein
LLTDDKHYILSITVRRFPILEIYTLKRNLYISFDIQSCDIVLGNVFITNEINSYLNDIAEKNLFFPIYLFKEFLLVKKLYSLWRLPK